MGSIVLEVNCSFQKVKTLSWHVKVDLFTLFTLIFLLLLFESRIALAETFTNITEGNGQCVDYARIKTGNNLTTSPKLGAYGGAYLIYDRWNYGHGKGLKPAINSLIILNKTEKLSTGHVGIVKSIIAKGEGIYELKIDESNWYLNDPVQALHETTDSRYEFDSNSMQTRRQWTNEGDRSGTQNSSLGGTSYPVRGFVYTEPLASPVEQQTACIANACWSPKSSSCEVAESWFLLTKPPYADQADSSICNAVFSTVQTIIQAQTPNDEVPEEHWWQTAWRFVRENFGISPVSGYDFADFIDERTILVGSDGQAIISSGNGLSVNDATGQGYQSPATEASPPPGLPDFTESDLKLMDKHGQEKYTYYLFDDEIEMHYWSTNIGEANWDGIAADIDVRFYLSKGYKARNSADDWVRIGTENIKQGNLNVGDIKHEWTTLDLHQYFSNGYLEDDHVYNIVVCVDRENDTDNGDGEVPEMHESNNCSSEAVFNFKESTIQPIERQALIALYDSTNGPGWADNTNWRTESDPCSWYGVGCANGHVASIYLWYNKMSGIIPAEIGNLTALESLTLAGGQLSGSIPPALGNLGNLKQLNLVGNQLSGAIPLEIGNLTNLYYLWLSWNQLNCAIPPEVGNLANLSSLVLGVNQLTGSIPPEIGNLTNLTNLNLEHNQLSGGITSEITYLPKLHTLDLSYNQLSGTIPSEIGNLNTLWWLNLEANQLSGSIPSEIGNLTNLYYLTLRWNQLNGSIPLQTGNLTNLNAMHLYNNQLSGVIPSSLENLINIESLDLGVNQLSGAIPPGIGNLVNLKYLDLNENQLSGAIPVEFGNLVKLESLQLQGNNLIGRIPLAAAISAPKEAGNCDFSRNDRSLCIPNTSAYRAIGLNPICNLPFLNSCNPGNLNHDSAANLADAIISLQIMAGITPSQTVYKENEVSGDGRIGMEEAIYILQQVSETP